MMDYGSWIVDWDVDVEHSMLTLLSPVSAYVELGRK